MVPPSTLQICFVCSWRLWLKPNTINQRGTPIALWSVSLNRTAFFLLPQFIVRINFLTSYRYRSPTDNKSLTNLPAVPHFLPISGGVQRANHLISQKPEWEAGFMFGELFETRYHAISTKNVYIRPHHGIRYTRESR